MLASDETWAEIKRAWCQTLEKPASIGARTGVAPLQIGAKARREGWTRPADPVAAVALRPKAQATRSRKAPPRRGPVSTPQRSRDALIRRMYAAVAAKLTQLEDRMSSSTELTQEESERQTRELTSMIQGFEKITEVAADAAKSDAAKPARAELATPADIERVREELAQRLHRMFGAERS